MSVRTLQSLTHTSPLSLSSPFLLLVGWLLYCFYRCLLSQLEYKNSGNEKQKSVSPILYVRPTCDLQLLNSWSSYAGVVFELTNIYIWKGFKLKEKWYIFSKMIKSVLRLSAPQAQKSRRHCQKYLIFMIWKNPGLWYPKSNVAWRYDITLSTPIKSGMSRTNRDKLDT
jgi:hypothetical protein